MYMYDMFATTISYALSHKYKYGYNFLVVNEAYRNANVETLPPVYSTSKGLAERDRQEGRRYGTEAERVGLREYGVGQRPVEGEIRAKLR